MQRARWAAGAAVVILAYVGLDVADVAPGIFTTESGRARAVGGAPAPPENPGSAASASPAPPAARLRPVDPASLPLAPAGTAAPAPEPAALAGTLNRLLDDPALGPGAAAVVRDGRTGAVLFEREAAAPRVPASVTKLVTAAAIGTSTAVNEPLTTRAVRGALKEEVVLVAGGDTLLATGAGQPGAVAGHAGLGDLAAQVAARLRADGVRSARVRLDEGPFAGPRIDPAWTPEDVSYGYAGPVAPLGLAAQRPTPGAPAPDDPALDTAEAFRSALATRGVAVPAGVERGRAPQGAEQLGSVDSAPLADQLGHALAESDNTLTSALARVAAVRAGQSADFAQVARWVTERAAATGVSVDGLTVADPSGLAPGSAASAGTIAALLAQAGTGSAPGLARILADLPTAGLEGTLADRFREGSARAGAGLVRAKTGTLTEVSALAGTVVDADGRLLVFAVLADHVPAGGIDSARSGLDRFAATLAGCGCR